MSGTIFDSSYGHSSPTSEKVANLVDQTLAVIAHIEKYLSKWPMAGPH